VTKRSLMDRNSEPPDHIAGALAEFEADVDRDVDLTEWWADVVSVEGNARVITAYHLLVTGGCDATRLLEFFRAISSDFPRPRVIPRRLLKQRIAHIRRCGRDVEWLEDSLLHSFCADWVGHDVFYKFADALDAALTASRRSHRPYADKEIKGLTLYVNRTITHRRLISKGAADAALITVLDALTGKRRSAHAARVARARLLKALGIPKSAKPKKQKPPRALRGSKAGQRRRKHIRFDDWLSDGRRSSLPEADE
jgi:hypothetical protein